MVWLERTGTTVFWIWKKIDQGRISHLTMTSFSYGYQQYYVYQTLWYTIVEWLIRIINTSISKLQVVGFTSAGDWLIMYCSTMETSPLPVKGCKILGLCSALGGHTCCDKGSWFFRSPSKDCPVQLPLATLSHTKGCGGPILTVQQEIYIYIFLM
jgi:hypothetical protein